MRPGVLLVKASPFCPSQGVEQAGFSDVASAQKRDFRQPVGGELLRPAALIINSRFANYRRPAASLTSLRPSAAGSHRPAAHGSTGGAAGSGSATISRSSAIFNTSSIDSTKCSFISLRMFSGISGRSFSLSRGRIAS